MLKVNTYSLKGTKLESVSLPKEYGEEVNLNILAQAIRVYEERSHVGFAKTKTRTEVNRTTKKIYKQKGTGGARHGSRSAPIYVGGGTAHGPKPVRRILTLSKKIVKKALNQAVSLKAENKEIVVLDGISKLAKTSDAKEFLNKLTKTEGIKTKKFTFVLSEKNLQARRFLRNLKNVEIVSFKGLNAFNSLLGGILVFDKDIFEAKKEVKTQRREVKK